MILQVAEKRRPGPADFRSRVTSAPPLGAGPVSVTVPAAPDPPATLTGSKTSEKSASPAGGLIVSVADCVTPFALALMVTVEAVRIVVVSIRKLALVDPWGTVTLTGTVASERSSLDSETGPSPAGAAFE